MYDRVGEVIFTTGCFIEEDYRRENLNYYLHLIELEHGERIIGIRSFDNGAGRSFH